MIAVIGALAFLPWLVFGLPAGMLVDRFDRRIIMAAANGIRCSVALWLAILTATGQISLWALFLGTLVFGLGETLFDNATNAVIPGVVARRQLDRANGRMQAAQVTIDSFIATPIAGVLFAVALALPLWIGAVGYVVPVALALLLPLSAARPLRDRRTVPDRDAPDIEVSGPTPEPIAVPPASTEVPAREAIAYLWSNHYLRAMVLFTSLVGSAFSFAQAATILYFLDEQTWRPPRSASSRRASAPARWSGRWSPRRSSHRFGRGWVMFSANFVAALAMLLTGLAPNAVMAVLAYGLVRVRRLDLERAMGCAAPADRA